MEQVPKIRRIGPFVHPIDRVIADHGAWRVLFAAARTLLRRNRVQDYRTLPDRLRRDVGLPEAPPGLVDWRRHL